MQWSANLPLEEKMLARMHNILVEAPLVESCIESLDGMDKMPQCDLNHKTPNFIHVKRKLNNHCLAELKQTLDDKREHHVLLRVCDRHEEHGKYSCGNPRHVLRRGVQMRFRASG